MIKISELSCINCGEYQPTRVSCCLPKLQEESWTLCGFCPTIFFIENLTKSAFFIAHMNNFHRENIDNSWGSQCSRCKSVFPTLESSQFHEKLCYKNVPFIKLNFQHVSVLLSQLKSQENLKSVESGAEISMELCGLCHHFVSGKNERTPRSARV